MGSVVFWNDEPGAWDILFIASDRGPSLRAPGIVKECKVSRGIKLDEKSAPGANGATLTYQGKKLAKVEIKLLLWTENDVVSLERMIADLFPNDAKGAPKPRDFVNARLALHGLKSLYVEELEGPEGPDEKGMVTVTLKCTQFAPTPKAAKAATTTPKSSLQSIDTIFAANLPVPANAFVGPPAPGTVVGPPLPRTLPPSGIKPTP
jgi:hypothetical protein